MRAYNEGVASFVTFGAVDGYVDAKAGEGSGLGGSLMGAGGGIVKTFLPVDETRTLFSSDANGWEKAEAGAVAITKLATLGLMGMQLAKPAATVTVQEGRHGVNMASPTGSATVETAAGRAAAARALDRAHAAALAENAAREALVPVKGIPARPTWQAAQSGAADSLAGFGFEAEPSYLGGKRVPYGTKGSVRPDYASERMNLSADVKDYDVSSPKGRWRLVKDIVGQTGARVTNLPQGMRQGVIIDIRGQQISDSLLQRMIDRIVKKSGGVIQPDNIVVHR